MQYVGSRWTTILSVVQLVADNSGIFTVPLVITDSPPPPMETYFHPALILISSSCQTDISRCAGSILSCMWGTLSQLQLQLHVRKHLLGQITPASEQNVESAMYEQSRRVVSFPSHTMSSNIDPVRSRSSKNPDLTATAPAEDQLHAHHGLTELS